MAFIYLYFYYLQCKSQALSELQEQLGQSGIINGITDTFY